MTKSSAKKTKKETQKQANKSYKNTAWVDNKNLVDWKCNIASLNRKADDLKKEMCKIINDLHSFNDPNSVFFHDKIEDLNALYWSWLATKEALRIVEKGY